MSSLWFAFIAMLAWGIGDFLIQKTVKKLDIFITLFWTCLFAVLALLPFVYQKLKLLNNNQIIFLSFAALIGLIGAYLHLKALKYGKLAIIEAIVGLELIFTIFLAVIFLQEVLLLWQIVLIIGLFFAVSLVSIDFKNLNKLNIFEKGSLLALIGALFFAGSNFLVSYGALRVISEIDPLIAIFFPWLLIAFFSFIIILKTKSINELITKSKRNAKLILAMVIVDLIAWLAFLFSVINSSLSLSIAIASSYPVIAAILGIVINKEKISLIQKIFLIIVFLFTFLIAYLS